MKKRILTALLAVMIVVSLSTVAALAEGSTTLPAADDNGVITLTEDVNLAATYVVSSDTTIDLNGFTLSSGALTTLIQVENDAKLIVIDSSNKTGKIVFSVPPFTFGAYMLNIAEGSIELNDISVEINSPSTVANVANGSSLKIKGGSVISEGSYLVNGSGSVSLDNMSISMSSIGNVLNQAYLSEGNVFVKTDASTVAATTTAPTEYNVKYGDWYYDQFGTISDMSITNYAKFADNDGNINITVNEKGSGSFSNGTLSSGSVNLVLNDGATINYKVVNSNVQSIKLAAGATITVSGTGNLDVGVIEPSGTLILKTTENADGSTTYSAEEPKDCFTIGTTNYDTLEAALEAANPGDIIVMNKDYTASNSITIDADDKITLDLGGNTLYMNGVNDVFDNTSSRSTTIFNQGDLTITNGNLSITSAVKKAINGIVNAEDAVLTVESTANLFSRGNTYEGSYVIVNLGGTVNTAGTINGNGNNGIVTYGGVLNITGGSVRGTGSSMAAAVDIFSRNYDSTSVGAKVNISGGDIYGATFALSTNNVKSGNSSLTITGGSISSQLTAIYWPSAGTLTIGTEGSQAGPTISSAEGSAIEIASGTLNVYGGTLQGGTAMTVADQTEVDAELVNEFRTHSGASNVGDAITVAANRAGGYAEAPLSVNIKGGTLESSQNYGVRYMDCNLGDSAAAQLEQSVCVEVSGGSISGTLGAVEASFVEPENQNFITGGEFSSQVSEYVAPGFDFEADNNGTYSYYTSREEAEKHGEVSYVGDDGVTVTFRDGSSVSSKVYAKGETLTMPTLSRSGYIFLGWRSGDKTFSAGESVTVSADITFTAVWGNLPGTSGTYPVTVAAPANGSVSVSLANASEGAVIKVTATPDEGYELAYVTVDGERISGTSFTMPDHAVTVSAVFVLKGLPFADVSAGAWYFDAVSYVYANGLMEGVSDTAFEPGGGMTRAMVWAILARVDGVSVTGSNWAETARSWAMAEGVSDGENASAPVTREQLVTMLWRFAGEPAVDFLFTAKDADAVSGWAYEAMRWAAAEGIIEGDENGMISPADGATRAQCAAILMRYVEA